MGTGVGPSLGEDFYTYLYLLAEWLVLFREQEGSDAGWVGARFMWYEDDACWEFSNRWICRCFDKHGQWLDSFSLSGLEGYKHDVSCY